MLQRKAYLYVDNLVSGCDSEERAIQYFLRSWSVLVSICIHGPQTVTYSQTTASQQKVAEENYPVKVPGTLSLIQCPYHHALVAQLQSPNDKSCDGPQQFLIFLVGYLRSQFLHNFFFNNCGRITLTAIPQWMRSFALVGRWLQTPS